MIQTIDLFYVLFYKGIQNITGDFEGDIPPTANLGFTFYQTVNVISVYLIFSESFSKTFAVLVFLFFLLVNYLRYISEDRYKVLEKKMKASGSLSKKNIRLFYLYPILSVLFMAFSIYCSQRGIFPLLVLASR
jgi:hypothetical protein